MAARHRTDFGETSERNLTRMHRTECGGTMIAIHRTAERLRTSPSKSRIAKDM